jgi:hypothetical protein
MENHPLNLALGALHDNMKVSKDKDTFYLQSSTGTNDQIKKNINE